MLKDEIFFLVMKADNISVFFNKILLSEALNQQHYLQMWIVLHVSLIKISVEH